MDLNTQTNSSMNIEEKSQGRRFPTYSKNFKIWTQKSRNILFLHEHFLSGKKRLGGLDKKTVFRD